MHLLLQPFFLGPLTVLVVGTLVAPTLGRCTARRPTVAGRLLGPVAGVVAALASVAAVEPCRPGWKFCLFGLLFQLHCQPLEAVLVGSAGILLVGAIRARQGSVLGWAALAAMGSAVALQRALEGLDPTLALVGSALAVSATAVGARRDRVALALVGLVIVAVGWTWWAEVGPAIAHERALEHFPRR